MPTLTLILTLIPLGTAETAVREMMQWLEEPNPNPNPNPNLNPNSGEEDDVMARGWNRVSGRVICRGRVRDPNPDPSLIQTSL